MSNNKNIKNKIRFKCNWNKELYESTDNQNFYKKSIEHHDINCLCTVYLVSGIDNRRVRAHRCILSAASDYFRAMFNSSMLESTADEIIFENINGDDLNNLVLYCYTSRIVINEQCISLLSVAHMLQFNNLVILCCDILASQLNLTNCIEMALFSERICCKFFMQITNNYICEHFNKIIKNKEYYTLSNMQIFDILASDYLNIECEELVLQSYLEWIKYDIKNRMPHTDHFDKLIRFEHFHGLIDKMSKNSISNNKYALDPESLKKFQIHFLRAQLREKQPRKFYKKFFILGFLNEYYATIESYCAPTREWTIEKVNIRLNQTVRGGITVIGDHLITIGGIIHSMATAKVESFNLKTMRTRNLLPLNQARYDCGVAILKNQIYVIGGYCNGNFLETVECCISLNGKWKYVGGMNMRKSNIGIIVHEGNIYAIGGSNQNSNYLNSVECYMPVKNKWFIKARLNIGRSECAVASAHGFLYAVGGNSGILKSVERFDAKLNKWTQICTISMDNTIISCAFICEKIFALNNIVKTYDFKNNCWSNDSKLKGFYKFIYVFAREKNIISL